MKVYALKFGQKQKGPNTKMTWRRMFPKLDCIDCKLCSIFCSASQELSTLASAPSIPSLTWPSSASVITWSLTSAPLDCGWVTDVWWLWWLWGLHYVGQGAFLSGGDVIIPDYAAEKYGRVAKLLNWTVLDNYHNHSVAEWFVYNP